MAAKTEVAILGAGPAAVASACALRRLGHEVSLIGVARNDATEGVSERTLRLLREYGLAAAASSICGPGERTGSWAGGDVAANTEYIAHRDRLDQALLADAAASGVPVRAEQVIRCEPRGRLWRVQLERDQLECRVVVDARGRRAQRAARKGPGLIAVCQRFRTERTGRVCTQVQAIAQGWCWLADDGQGMTWLQLTSSAKEPSLRLGLGQHLRQSLEQAPGILAALAQATPWGAPLARAATPSLATARASPGLIRAGDAAVAIDPLSGQGMYEALRSAAVVIGAVRGYLAGSWEPGARFLAERAREIWERASATAAQHYGEQARRTPSSFWTGAYAIYRSLASPPPTPAAAYVDWRPVLNHSVIELRRVVITAQAPRGVWQVDAVDLPRLLDVLDAADHINIESVARNLACPPVAIARALRWLASHGLLNESSMRSSRGSN